METNNPTLDDLKALVDKVRSEATRCGYTDGAYDAIAAFCRAIGIPAIYVSRPSLWATPMDRGRALEEYTDADGAEELAEIASLVRQHFDRPILVTNDTLWDGEGPVDVSPLTMPQCELDIQAMLESGGSDNG